MGAARLRAIARTRDVQMTSRRLRFIQLSHFSRLPLYVSPLFSSTSCSPAHMRTREGGAGRRELRAEREGEAPYHRVAHRGAEERERQHPPPAPACPSSLSIHCLRLNETLSETLVFLGGFRVYGRPSGIGAWPIEDFVGLDREYLQPFCKAGRERGFPP